MNKTEPTTSPFRMHAARSALGNHAGSIADQLDVIEQTIQSIPDLTFDLAKGLVDSVCKTVLADLGETPDPKWNTPKLVKETIARLKLISHNHGDAAKATQSLKMLTGGLSTVVAALCELRNQHGMSAHGKDDHGERLTARQAVLAAQAADVVSSYLYQVHRDERSQNPGHRVHHDDYADFNREFNEANEPVTIAGITFEASKIYCALDSQAYRDALIEYQTQGAQDDGEADAEGDNA